MANDGDYPFYVKVRNRFSIVEEVNGPRPDILVTYHYRQHGNKCNSFSNNSHPIKPGEALSFPLHWRDEYLEIIVSETNSSTLPDKLDYYVWCGTKALCFLYDDATKETSDGIKPIIPALEGKKSYPLPILAGSVQWNCNVGGAWAFNTTTNNKKFTLVICKRTDDPEEENVTIGEDPPG